MNHLINLASKYFTAWNTNSVDELKPLLSDDVTLTDWDIDVSGLDSVLGANEQIFETAQVQALKNRAISYQKEQHTPTRYVCAPVPKGWQTLL